MAIAWLPRNPMRAKLNAARIAMVMLMMTTSVVTQAELKKYRWKLELPIKSPKFDSVGSRAIQGLPFSAEISVEDFKLVITM